MLKYGEAYVDKGMNYYQEKYRENEIRRIQKKAKELGLVATLTPAAALDRFVDSTRVGQQVSEERKLKT